MFSSDAFAYVNMLDRAADASYVRQGILAHNLANVDTPTYKRSDVDFQNILEKKLLATHQRDVAGAVKKLDISKVKPRIYEDHSNFSYRIDRNNVDVDTENVEIASEQLRYQMITTLATGTFARFNVVLNS